MDKETSSTKSVYAIGERLAVLKHIAEKYNFRLDRTAGMTQFGRRNTNPDATAMLQAIRRERPDLLWIQWHSEAREPCRRAQVRSAVDFLSGLARVQLSLGGNVLVEGRASDLPARDEVFQAPGRLGDLLGEYNRIFWCAIGAQTPRNTQLCGEHLVYSHPAWKDIGCVCNRRSNNYAADNGEGYEQFIVCALTHHEIISQSNWKPISSQWHVTQRQLRTKEGAKEYVQNNLLVETCTLQPQSTDQEPSPIKTAVPSSDLVPRVASAKEEMTVTSVALTTMETPPKSVTFNLTEQVYPTDAAVRAKEVRKAREARGQAEGKTLQEIRKRQPQQQEEHFDDCGSDTGPIEEKALMLDLSLGNEEEVCAHCYFDSDPEPSNWDHEFEANQELNYLLGDSQYQLHHLLGSDGEETHEFRQRPPMSSFVSFPELLSTVNARPDSSMPRIDIMEIWGGNAGVSKVSIRRCLRTGQNFDIVTGADLTKYHNQQVLLNYIRQHRPLVIVMGPPCTAFSSWSHINQYNAPNTYTASRQTGQTPA